MATRIRKGEASREMGSCGPSSARRARSRAIIRRNGRVGPCMSVVLDVTSKRLVFGPPAFKRRRREVRLLQCTLRNGRPCCPVDYTHRRIRREIANNDLVLRSTLLLPERLRPTRANQLICATKPSRGEGSTTAARLDGPNQYRFGWRARRESPRSESAWNAGRASRIVQEHDGTSQVDRFGYSPQSAVLAI
ncbi:hypothetical protein GGD64_000436 [Bradyrhizobium sp. CIR3A]|nr:hypothetical protein [Bradyrhizobium sp. CIR3A]NYG43532.1 hypothetical protein [Bradyrhizobium sp. IAR9]